MGNTIGIQERLWTEEQPESTYEPKSTYEPDQKTYTASDLSRSLEDFRRQVRIHREEKKQRYETLNQNWQYKSRKCTLSQLRRSRDLLLAHIGLHVPITNDDTVVGIRREISKLHGTTIVGNEKSFFFQYPKHGIQFWHKIWHWK